MNNLEKKRKNFVYKYDKRNKDMFIFFNQNKSKKTCSKISSSLLLERLFSQFQYKAFIQINKMRDSGK